MKRVFVKDNIVTKSPALVPDVFFVNDLIESVEFLIPAGHKVRLVDENNTS